MFGLHPVLSVLLVMTYLLGLSCAAFAVLHARTPQGATAWVIGLLTVPFLTVPFFIIFGGSRFYGYAHQRKLLDYKVSHKLSEMEKTLMLDETVPSGLQNLIKSIAPLCRPGFTCHNKIQILIDGKETYWSMLEELEKAQDYIIFQFYIFRADAIGYKFAEVLMRKAREGIRVSFLYDEIGTGLPQELIDQLKQAGVQICHFNSSSGKGRFQINFRNHRKILIVDGKVAFVGGLNIGDDYLGLWSELGFWRDTHLKLEGPAVIAIQLAHAKDWYWSKDEVLLADWKIRPTDSHGNVLILPSGPADQKQTCLLAHLAMVNSAQKRLWIANPYFVPPESLMDAILLASLRGVDVRILIPSVSDAKLVMRASEVYVHRLLEHGVKVYRYLGGFMHQKVMLVDDLFAVIGTANFDSRSMFINFEISVVAQETKFIQDVEQMLRHDFDQIEEILWDQVKNEGLWKKITSRAANLMAPVL